MTTTTHDLTDNNTTLSALFLNINGMSEEKKKNKVFQILINKNIYITLIQETHATKHLTSKWEKEWLGKLLWNFGKLTKSLGVAIPLKNNLNINIYTTLKDKESRILSLNFSIEKQNYQIINIYAPTRNSKRPKLYQYLKNYIDPKQNLILGGDFNMVEDILLDRKGGQINPYIRA